MAKNTKIICKLFIDLIFINKRISDKNLFDTSCYNSTTDDEQRINQAYRPLPQDIHYIVYNNSA